MPKRTSPYLTFTTAALASVVALVFVAAGCSDGTTPDGDTCFDYSTFNAMSKTVSFQTDVLPIFRNSCGLSASCHGVETGSVGKVYLGPPLGGDATPAQISAIMTQIVGVASSEAATMKIVEANMPAKSFLMHKMDNTLTCADVTCEAGCGTSMPQLSPILGEAERNTVRLWIAQGAKND